MVETKLAEIRIDISKDTGEIMLFIETGCGFRPVMGWPDVRCLHSFADNLLGICSDINNKVQRETDNVLGDTGILQDIDWGNFNDNNKEEQ